MAGEILRSCVRDGAVDHAAVGQITRAFHTTIEVSFAQDMSRVTRAEIERRFRILERVFRALRSELKWSVPKILDHLLVALRQELDGGKWNPESVRTAWVADGSLPDDPDPPGEPFN